MRHKRPEFHLKRQPGVFKSGRSRTAGEKHAAISCLAICRQITCMMLSHAASSVNGLPFRRRRHCLPHSEKLSIVVD
jgi:hypothetical protein